METANGRLISLPSSFSCRRQGVMRYDFWLDEVPKKLGRRSQNRAFDKKFWITCCRLALDSTQSWIHRCGAFSSRHRMQTLFITSSSSIVTFLWTVFIFDSARMKLKPYPIHRKMRNHSIRGQITHTCITSAVGSGLSEMDFPSSIQHSPSLIKSAIWICLHKSKSLQNGDMGRIRADETYL